MKKILFVAASAILLAAGCQKTEVLNQAVGDPMTFSTGMAKLTKSPTATGEQNLATQNFQVWSYTAYTDDLNSVIPGRVYENINGIIVNYDIAADGTGSCSTTEDYYWPGTGLKLDFFAISSKSTFTSASSPATVDETEGGTGDDTDQGSTGENTETPTDLSVSFENPGLTLGQRKMTLNGYSVTAATMNSGAAIGADDDLMVAEFVRQDQAMGDPKKSVSLHFKHALSKVAFQFKTNSIAEDAPIVHVTSFSINDVVTTGNLNVTESSVAATELTGDSDGTRKAVVLDWEYEETPTKDNISVSFTTNNQLTTTAADLSVTKLLMPQGLTDKKLTVNYTITEAGNASAEPRPFTIDFDLSAATVNEWGINQAITYTISLSPNTITFNPDVAPWETVGEDTSMSN